MNKSTLFNSKKGVVFLLDVFVSTMLIVGTLIFFTPLLFTNSAAPDVPIMTTTSLYTSLDQSNILATTFLDGDTELQNYLDTAISSPYCARVLGLSTAGSVLFNTTKSNCNFPVVTSVSSFSGTYQVETNLRIVRVYTWLE